MVITQTTYDRVEPAEAQAPDAPDAADNADELRSNVSSTSASLPSMSTTSRELLSGEADIDGLQRATPNFNSAHSPNTRQAPTTTVERKESLASLASTNDNTNNDLEGYNFPVPNENLLGSPIINVPARPRGTRSYSMSIGSLGGEMRREISRRGTAVPEELLGFFTSAKRRASRVGPLGLGGDVPMVASEHGSPPASPKATAHDNTDNEELEALREELERSRADCLQMADLGSALLVDLEDAKASLKDAETERDQGELRAEALQDKVHTLLREGNELKRNLAQAREAMEDERRRHTEEVSALLRDDHFVPHAAATQFEQSIALTQLRRAKLLAERVEAAKLLFHCSSAEPQVLEAEHRRSIDQQMWNERVNLVYEFYHSALYGWAATANELEICTMSVSAGREQMHGLVQARLRAEGLATEEAELRKQICRRLAEQDVQVKHLTAVAATRRALAPAGASVLGSTVQTALSKVRALNSQCEATQSLILSPARSVLSPTRSEGSPGPPRRVFGSF